MSDRGHWGQRFNQGVAAVVAVGCLAWATQVGTSAWPWAPLLWLYVVCGVLLVEWVVLRTRGLRPALFGPLHHLEPHLPTFAVGVVLVVTLLREGLFAPGFVLQLGWWSATHQVSGSYDARSSYTGSAPVSFRGAPVHCNFNCSPASAVCEGIDDALGCNERPLDGGSTSMSVTVNVSPPFCYLPLFKRSDTSYTATFDASLARLEGTRTGGGSASGQVSMSATGMMSCRSYRRLLGRQIGKRLVSDLDGFLAAH